MNAQELFDKVVQMQQVSNDVPTTPPVELVALIIRWARQIRNWKVATLADFSRVSVSTIERVERGQRVREEALDRIAQALGYGRGAFHVARLCQRSTQAAEEMAYTLANLEQVAVSPMKTQRAVRQAMGCQAFLVHRPEVPEVYDQDIASLVEWLDFAACCLSRDIHMEGEEPPSRRRLYTEILSCVRALERRGLTVLSGVMQTPQPKHPGWRVAIISITPKLTDPGAVKRTHIFVDRRNIVLSNMEFGDIGSIIAGCNLSAGNGV